MPHIDETLKAALKRQKIAADVHDTVQHIHYCALKHLRGILISAIFVIVIALSGLPGIWTQTINELGNSPRQYGQRKGPLRRLAAALRRRWRVDMTFYTYWLKDHNPRKAAWEEAQKVM